MRSDKRGFWASTVRLFRMADKVKAKLAVSTLASMVGNASHLGIMGFGAMLVLFCAGWVTTGSAWLWGGLMAVCAFGIISCRYIEGMVSHAASYELLAHMRVQMFETVKSLAPACLVDRQKGDILSVAVADIETVEFFFAHTIGPIFTVVLLPLITLLLAGSVNPLFVWVLLPLYLVISVLLPYLALRLGRGVGRRYRAQVGQLKSSVLESVYGLRDIQIFGAGAARKKEVLDQTAGINRSAHQLTIHRQLVTAAPTFFVYLARILLIAVASYLTQAGAEPAGVIVLSFVVSASFSSTQSLTAVVSSLLETYAAAERIFALEDALPEVVEHPNPVELGPIERIEFHNVTFCYRPGGEPVLKNINLVIGGGDAIGVVGESGIGKSTIIRLLLRFWEPTEGEIRINGIPLRNISLESLRRRIALLEQDTFVFSGTLAENIAFGSERATAQEIELAARRAGIHDFITALPAGYHTPMGELGDRLSGGEKQRLGIARVLLANPDVLVMDEPTSSLDILNEKGILKTLEQTYRDKMVVLVSHRPSTLTGCNRILRLAGGELREGDPRPAVS